MRGVAEGLVILVLTAVIWAYTIARPNELTEMEVKPLTATAGQTVRLISTAKKADWAAAFCKLENDTVFIVDSEGVVRERSIEGRAKNYNDGSIYKHILDFTLPTSLPIGPTKVYKRLTYVCFGLIEYQIFTNRGRWGTVIIEERKSNS